MSSNREYQRAMARIVEGWARRVPPPMPHPPVKPNRRRSHRRRK